MLTVPPLGKWDLGEGCGQVLFFFFFFFFLWGGGGGGAGLQAGTLNFSCY